MEGDPTGVGVGPLPSRGHSPCPAPRCARHLCRTPSHMRLDENESGPRVPGLPERLACLTGVISATGSTERRDHAV